MTGHRSIRLAAALVAVVSLLQSGAVSPARAAGDNVVVRWADATLAGVRSAGGQHVANKLGPPMTARALAIVQTCEFDAWAAYDDVAVGTRLGGTLRRPSVEHTDANKAEAISFAAYRALMDVMPVEAATYQQLMTDLGYDYNNDTTDVTTPAGVGNVACQAELDYRHKDGSNQLGDLHSPAYSDYTGYKPVNEPMVVYNEASDGSNGERAPIDLTTVHDPSRWQPLTYSDQNKTRVTPKAIGIFWGRVIPFAMSWGGQLRSSTGPAVFGTPEYLKQAIDLVMIQANLSDEQKCIAEYFADGPNSELPPGHWVLFANFVARRDSQSIDDSVKMFFAMTNAVSDAGIVAWDNKGAFDSVRPVTAVRYLFNGVLIPAWAGPGLGTQLIDGGNWLPYQAPWFPTPPFPEYSSGHSNFSAAGAEALKLYTGSDVLGLSVTIPAGSTQFEPGITPSHDVTLTWPTFTEAANEAGISRRYGGIHFEQGDLDARATGRQAARLAFAKARSYWEGTAIAPTSVTADAALVNLDEKSVKSSLSAQLVNALTQAGIAGKTLEFRVGDTILCQSTTDARGVATCGATAEQLQAAANSGYTVTFAGDETSQASGAAGHIVRGLGRDIL